MDPTFPLVPVFNFLSFLLICLPVLSSALRSGSWNVAVTSFALWNAINCIITGINAIIWSDNVRDIAPVWCDITTHLDYSNGIAIRACTFVLTRSLYHITLCGEGSYLHNKRSRFYFDLCWTIGLPILTMIYYYVFQERRYQIVEEEGCVLAAGTTGLSILLYDAPYVLLPMASALYYSPRICWSLYKLRQHNKGSISQDPSFSNEIYYRMMILGCVDAILTLPLSIFLIVAELVPPPTSFYPGWDEIHSNFSTIPTVRADEWKEDFWFALGTRWDLWSGPVSAIPFFVLFGLTIEARTVYYALLWKVLRVFGLKRPETQSNAFSEMKFGTAVERHPTVRDSRLDYDERQSVPSLHTKLESTEEFVIISDVEKGARADDSRIEREIY